MKVTKTCRDYGLASFLHPRLPLQCNITKGIQLVRSALQQNVHDVVVVADVVLGVGGDGDVAGLGVELLGAAVDVAHDLDVLGAGDHVLGAAVVETGLDGARVDLVAAAVDLDAGAADVVGHDNGPVDRVLGPARVVGLAPGVRRTQRALQEGAVPQRARDVVAVDGAHARRGQAGFEGHVERLDQRLPRRVAVLVVVGEALERADALLV
ncbi:hypothetical protein PG995_006440 [Apiospora arundinis]